MTRISQFSISTLFVFICSITGLAQAPSDAHNSSGISPDARFELVQSSLVAKLTLKIDKFTGDVFQLVTKSDGEFTWQRIPKIKHNQDSVALLSKVNYQLFTSGLAAKFTYLLNVNTGASWRLVEDAKEGLFWDPIF